MLLHLPPDFCKYSILCVPGLQTCEADKGTYAGPLSKLVNEGSYWDIRSIYYSRCEAQPNPRSSPRQQSHQGIAKHPSKLKAVPCSPWPEPNYQPEAPEEEYDVERGMLQSNALVLGPGVQAEGLWREETGDAEQAACCARLAQVLEERPELQERLMAMLSDENSMDDHLLKLQVIFPLQKKGPCDIY